MARPARRFASVIVRLAAAAAVLQVLAGCVSADLSSVHDTYRSEFQAQFAAHQGPDESALLPAKDRRFPETLAAIGAFRSEHGDQADANKHLAVLEAMVYLQTGRYGLTALAADAAAAMPGDLSTADGASIRDQLFLDAMQAEPGLIEAFEALGGPGGGTLDVLDACAANLRRLVERTKTPATDDGRLYVAAVSAMCSLGAAEKELIAVVGSPDERPAKRQAIRRRRGQEVVDVLGPLLNEPERTGGLADLQALAAWSPRHRYAVLHHAGKQLRDGTEDGG